MEESKKINRKFNSNQNNYILCNTFINSVNALSNSIKKYYKVSIKIIENMSILIKSFEEILTIFGQENNISKEIKEIFYQLNMNINSEKNNLNNFLNDTKTIFKEMKEYQNSTKNKIIEQRNYSLNKLKSNISGIIESNENSAIFHKINLKTNRDTSHSKTFIQKNQNLAKRKPNQIYYKDINVTSNFFNSNNSKSNLLEEIETIKKINKNYEFHMKKLNLELEKFNNSYNGNNSRIININDSQKTQDELILNENKIISSLKQELEKSNKRNEQISRNFKASQTQINILKEENNKLYTLINSDKTLFYKFNNLMKENSRLKKTIDALSSSYNNSKSVLNYKINFNNNNTKLKNEMKLHKNISFTNQLEKEKNKNEKLKKENMITDKNKTELINNQNKLVKNYDNQKGKKIKIINIGEGDQDKNNNL